MLAGSEMLQGSEKTPHESRIVEVTHTGESVVNVALAQRHLLDIIQGSAFKSSRRSQEFLKYIVEKALKGDFNALKERAIGIELFGRSPSYDTGEDAIVRVTASDVRRRLLQHYGEYGVTSGFRIDLPPGTYSPEFRTTKVTSGQNPVRVTPERTVDVVETKVVASALRRHRVLMSLALLIALSGLVSYLSRARATSEIVSTAVLPWSALFHGPGQTTIVTSDADLVEVQELTGGNVSLAGYANQKYVPNLVSLDGPTRQLCLRLRGDHTASVDTEIALRISELAYTYSQPVHARSARNLTLADLQSDDQFIFLGSPRSNPWSALFEDQLDFSFEYDPALKREVIRNRHPQNSELARYVPTALGWETGQAFAIAAFVNNPNQKGHVLLLAGSNAEGTQSAAKFVTDAKMLSNTLRRNGIQPTGPVQNFEALLRLRTMAGAPRSFEVLALHRLSD